MFQPVRNSVQKIIIIWRVDFSKRDQEKMPFRTQDFSIWPPERDLTPIVLLVISLDRMQMRGSIGPGAGKPLIWDEYSGYSQALHSY